MKKSIILYLILILLINKYLKNSFLKMNYFILMLLITPNLATISDNLDLSTDENCGKLITNSTILPSDTKIIANE